MFAGRQLISVHRQTHGTAGFAPFHAGGGKDPVQAFFFRLLLDQPGAWNHEGAFDVVGDSPAFDNTGSLAQILDPGIGAGTDKDVVQPDIPMRIPGSRPMYASACSMFPRLAPSDSSPGSGDGGIYRRNHFGEVPLVT